MKRLLLILGATALLVAPSRAQVQNAQEQNNMTPPEFRQTLVDLGSYLDSHKGTDLRRRFEAVPDDMLTQIQSAVPNARQLQRAVAALRQHDAERALNASPSLRSVSPMAVAGSCPPNTIIDTSNNTCTPAYPDPTNTAWQALVNPLITFGAFSGLSSSTDYADVSPQGCSLTVESNLSQVSSALQGTVLAASSLCSALPPIASNVCWGINAVFSIADAVSFGLFADCTEQDGNINAAEIDAAFHNTVTIYNALGPGFAGVNTNISGVNTNLTNVNSTITGEFGTLNTNLLNDNTAITNEFNANNTHLTNVNAAITNEFNAATTQLANVDTHVATELTALSAQLVTLVNQLSNQVGNGTALADAELRQVMKLLLTPDGQKVIDPPILTCNGTNCPNVLAACPKAGCSWNNVGPLP